jgi:hypothetical protein
MTTPAVTSRTPTNAFAPPFVPANMMVAEGRPSTSNFQGVLSSHLPPPLPHAGILAGDRMPMAGMLFPDEQHPFHVAPTLGMRKLNEDQILQGKVENILREWISICYTPSAQRDPQNALACIVQMVGLFNQLNHKYIILSDA